MILVISYAQHVFTIVSHALTLLHALHAILLPEIYLIHAHVLLDTMMMECLTNVGHV